MMLRSDFFFQALVLSLVGRSDKACCQLVRSADRSGETTLDSVAHLSSGVSISSSALHIRARQGDDVVIPCVLNGEEHSGVLVMWKRLPSDILFTGVIRMRPDRRFNIINSHSLRIKHVRAGDAGQYVCSLQPLPPDNVAAGKLAGNARRQQLTHTLTVLTEARVLPLERDEFTVNEGDSVQVLCRASGHPPPVVSWTKPQAASEYMQMFGNATFDVISYNSANGTFDYDNPEVTAAQQLTIARARPQHAGTYTCTALNDIGPADSTTVTLHVLHAPYIAVDETVVRTAQNLRAEMSCRVFSNPQAEVSWSIHAAAPTRFEHVVAADKFSLLVHSVRPQDFGNYTCRAHNVHGNNQRRILLTGLPGVQGVGVYLESGVSGGVRRVAVTWRVSSATSLTHITVTVQQLRPRKSAPRRIEVRPDASYSSQHDGRHVLPSVRPGVYSVIVRVANKYGWSSSSDASRVLFRVANGRLEIYKNKHDYRYRSALLSTWTAAGWRRTASLSVIVVLSTFLLLAF